MPEPDLNFEYVGPESDLEERLLEICHEIVENYDFGVTTNLYNVGFSSLTMMKLAYEISVNFNKSLVMADLFKNVTVRDIANRLNQIENTINVDKTYKEFYPLSSNQRKMFNETMLSPSKRVFQSSNLITTKLDDPIKLKNALIELIEFTPALRLIITDNDGEIVQKVTDDINWMMIYFYKIH